MLRPLDTSRRIVGHRVDATTTASENYRPDIDGLRAIAVVPVVFYHYRFPLFTGGYVGVDVFFVISGYLITSLIYREMLEERFSIMTFYERRVRRIFPALFFLLLVVTLLSFVLLLPNDLRRYGQSLVATTFFLSNFEFWRESGYFDVSSAVKPLIHTWSLAVEEQFYLVFPLLLYLLRGLKRNQLLLVLAAISLASFALSAWAVQDHPDFAFYLAPARVWELFLGALLALARLPQPQNIHVANAIGLTGVGLIAYSVCAFNSRTIFPGPAAVIPCLGAACVLYTGVSANTFCSRALSTRPFVFVGLISYSLYLWHWPLLVFANYYALHGLSLLERLSLVVLSLVIAAFAWRFVETPFRRKRAGYTRKSLFGLSVIAMGAAVSTGLVAIIFLGLPGRLPINVRNVVAEANDYSEKIPCLADLPPDISPANLCVINASAHASPSFLLWGDSLASALLPAIDQVANRERRSGLLAEHDACPPLLGISRSDTSVCRSFNDAALKVALEPTVREVILVGRWALSSEGSRYGVEPGSRVVLFDSKSKLLSTGNNHAVFADALWATIEKLRLARKKVVFVESTPEIGWPVPETLAKLALLHSEMNIAPTQIDYLSRQAFVMATAQRLRAHFGIKIVDLTSALCPTKMCILEKSGRPIYTDDHHLSAFGARRLVPLLEPYI